MINNAQRYQNELTAGGYKIMCTCTHNWTNCYKYDWHYVNDMCQVHKDIQVIAPDIQRYTNNNTRYTKIYQSYPLASIYILSY